MFSFTRHARRIESLYRATSADTRAAGLIWYEREHAYAATLARASGQPVASVCACLAILSPRCRWPRVKTACEALLAGHKPRGLLPHNLAKAVYVLERRNGIPIHRREAPKTWSFWQNLCDPKDPYPVTLDSWMLRAHDLPPKSGIGTYDALADAYRAVAHDLGLIPNQLQAVIWLHVKGQAR